MLVADTRSIAAAHDQFNRAIKLVPLGEIAAQTNLVGADKKVLIGSGAIREVPDWHLTRYAAYLVAMNGDPSKPEIAT